MLRKRVRLAVWSCVLVLLGCRHSSNPSVTTTSKVDESPRMGPGTGRLAPIVAGLRIENGRLRVASPSGTLPETHLLSGDFEARARQLLRQNRKREALEVTLEWVRAVPADGDGWTLLSRALRRAGFVEAAAAAARKAMDLQPGQSDPRIALAWSLEQLGQRAEALAVWEAVAATEPPRRQTHRRLAALHHLVGDPASAAHHALAVDGNWPLAAEGWSEPPRRQDADLPISVSPAVRIDVTGGTAQAAEVSLSATPDGFLVAAWNDLREAGPDGEWRLGWATSEDGGESWVDGLLRPPGAMAEDFEGDPITAFDPTTGTLWVGGTQFFGDDIYLSRRPTGGEFTAPVVISTGSLDRGQMVVGTVPGNPQSTLLHLAHLSGLQTSADQGETWGAVVPWAEVGFAQHPAVGLDGEIYVTYSDFADRIVMQRSLDGGASLEPVVEVALRLDTWDTQDGSRFPGQFRVATLPFLASSPVDGALYCVYFDTTAVVGGQANVDIYLTTSRDRGETWSTPRVVNGDSDPPGDQFHPWIEVDEAGRIHLLFFDSRNTQQVDDVEDGRLDVYHSVSDDLGVTWTETRLTNEPFGTGVIDWSVSLPQFLGDFLGIATAGERTWVAYPTTENGNLDLFVREILLDDAIFEDGFESGDTTAW